MDGWRLAAARLGSERRKRSDGLRGGGDDAYNSPICLGRSRAAVAESPPSNPPEHDHRPDRPLVVWRRVSCARGSAGVRSGPCAHRAHVCVPFWPYQVKIAWTNG